ncbi:MAG: dTMP kinase [Nitrospirota bacterium]|nr:dTMP kinase [Nitrospirota bacterium]
MNSSAKFITIEGIEGAGKSTQLRLLAKALTANGEAVTVTREPGGTPFAEQIRDLVLAHTDGPVDPECELYLYLAARAEHVAHHILPRLKSGDWVICDRFTDATVAYQGNGRGLETAWVRHLAEHAGRIKPALTLLLDLPVETGLARMRERGAGNRLDLEHTAFHQEVRKGYLEAAEAEPERIARIDASTSLEQIHRQIVATVNQRLGAHLPAPLAPALEGDR